MSSNNSIYSSTFTEVELSLIAMGLYLLISPIHGVSKITKPLLKMLNIKSPTSLLLFSGLLFGVIYYFSIKLVLGPLYTKIRKSGFKVGGQVGQTHVDHCTGVNDPPGCTPQVCTTDANTPYTGCIRTTCVCGDGTCADSGSRIYADAKCANNWSEFDDISNCDATIGCVELPFDQGLSRSR